MGIFSGLFANVKRKFDDMKERQEFLNMVEDQAKPRRRAAYMKQALKEVVAEGVAMAKADSAKKLQKKKTPQDFGINMQKDNSIASGLEDPMKFLNPKKKTAKETTKLKRNKK